MLNAIAWRFVFLSLKQDMIKCQRQFRFVFLLFLSFMAHIAWTNVGNSSHSLIVLDIISAFQTKKTTWNVRVCGGGGLSIFLLFRLLILAIYRTLFWLEWLSSGEQWNGIKMRYGTSAHVSESEQNVRQENVSPTGDRISLPCTIWFAGQLPDQTQANLEIWFPISSPQRVSRDVLRSSETKASNELHRVARFIRVMRSTFIAC